MKNKLAVCLAVLVIVGCKTDSKKTTSAPKAELTQHAIKKVDVHAHFKYKRDYLGDFFEKWNMQVVLVDVSIADSSQVNRSWNAYVDHAQAEPHRFYLCSSLIGLGIDEPDFAQKAIERLEQELLEGARMVKVWKNFGMVTQDASGKFIQIDDPRLQPIWDFLIEREIPVMAHIGEPVQAWRPLDDPNNPHFGYYTEHPEYHAYKHKEIPSYETIIAARDNWIQKNAQLKILCAHLGSMSHDVAMVGERLDKFQNIYVEPAARFGDLAGQNSDKVRDFFIAYQDRILFGTDYGNSSPQDGRTPDEIKAEVQHLDDSYARLWTYLSSTDSVALRGQKNTGLGLDEAVLKKIYYENAARFLNLK